MAAVHKPLADQEKSIKAHFEAALQEANVKILKPLTVSETVTELKASLEYSQTEIDQLKALSNTQHDESINLQNI